MAKDTKTERISGTAVIQNDTPLKIDVTIWPIEPKKNLIGYASLKINDGFVMDDFKVLQGEKGIFVGMPSKPDGKGGYRDTAKPITKEFRAQLTEAVTTAYHEAAQKLKERAPESITKGLADGAEKAKEHNAALPHKEKGGKNVDVDL
jgi:DNA-binding cell septation regulator SpoVG